MQKISFFIDGQRLSGTLYIPKTIHHKNPAILFLHGWRSSEESPKGRAIALSEAGYICMTFDMRGCGKSEGDFKKLTRQDYVNDVIAAYDFLSQQKGVDVENISIVGASFGAYLSTLVTKKRNVKNLVLRVPANYPDSSLNDIQFIFSGYEVVEELYAKFKEIASVETFATEALNEYDGHVLIIESENDDFIPHEMVEKYKNAVQDKSKLTYILMQNADHSMKDEKFRQQYTQILLDWFATLKK
jgi:esterase/lipase